MNKIAIYPHKHCILWLFIRRLEFTLKQVKRGIGDATMLQRIKKRLRELSRFWVVVALFVESVEVFLVGLVKLFEYGKVFVVRGLEVGIGRERPDRGDKVLNVVEGGDNA